MKSEEDKLKLKNIKNDIFVNKLPYKRIIEKYFKYVDKIEVCYNNIAYENKTCKSVSNKIRELLNKEKEYEADDIVICKEYFKIKGFAFNVNIRYRTINIDSGIATLRNVKTSEEQSIPIELLRSKFIYSYCYTAHSCQGCSIDNDHIIYDWNKPYVSREWFYVALTRSTDLNKIMFYRYA